MRDIIQIISAMIKDHAKNASAKYYESNYFCCKFDYEKVQYLYKPYFDSDKYEKRLTQIERKNICYQLTV
tara:strand:- start:1712 stop:1921 length:210 start_codon:yes stop_codon:yes gene_type:complete